VKEVSERHVEETVDFSLFKLSVKSWLLVFRGSCDFLLHIHCKKFCRGVKYVPLKVYAIFTCILYSSLLVYL
jgi:hypothetical protein